MKTRILIPFALLVLGAFGCSKTEAPVDDITSKVPDANGQKPPAMPGGMAPDGRPAGGAPEGAASTK